MTLAFGIHVSDYIKLPRSLSSFSLWREDSDTFKLWFGLLDNADTKGFVYGSDNANWLAYRCQISPEKTRSIIARFELPNQLAANGQWDGTRLKRVEDGWMILDPWHFPKQRTNENPQGFVYYAAEPNSEEIKIGFSRNPEARMSELRVSRPQLSVVAEEPGTMDTEKSRHRQFARYRKHGEWFDYCAEIRRLVDELCQSIEEDSQ